LQQLRQNPELIEAAVDELLRFDSPVQWVSRVAREEFEFGGVTLKPGDILLGSLGAANRDPAVFTNPDQLDLLRSDNKHLSFGSGIHFCLGAALARMEAQIAIGTLVRELPNLRLVRQKIKWKKGLIFRAIEKLEVAW
jgi:pimeloyl-[acyl-carrier protein] synthase